MNKKQLATDIIELVGGEKNIAGLEHCATRLRFTLKENKKAKVEKIEKLDGVMGVINASTQLQIIIGNQVHEVCEEIYAQIGMDFKNKEDAPAKKEGNIIMRALAIIPRVFTPVLPVLTACGLLKAVVAVMQIAGVDTATSTFSLINMASDIIFYFMPVFVAVSASKVFKTNMYMGLLVGAMLLHPTWAGLVGAKEAVTLLGLPVALVSYNGSMLPALLGVWILSYVEKFFDKYIPEGLKFIFAPLCTALTMLVVMFVAVGPLGFYCGKYISDFLMGIYDVAGWLAVVLIAAFKPLLVMTGMHYALSTAFLTMFTATGIDKFYLSSSILSNLAQGGAAFGVFLKTKDKKMKSVALSTSFSAIMGITEPAMFGVTLKYKRPFVAAMIGAAAGGLYAGITSVEFLAMAGVGIFGILGAVPQCMLNMCIAAVITLVVSAAVTVVLGFEEDTDVQEEKKEVKPVVHTKEEISKIIVSPMSGEVVDLALVKDAAFSSEALGKGAAINPEEGKVYSPVNGTVSALFQTNHAIGLTSETGEEILIHIGLDTVNLKGKYFHPAVKQDDAVKQGDLLMEFDLEEIKAEGYDVTTPVIVTNKNDYMDVFAVNTSAKIKSQEALLAVIDK